MPSSLIAQSRLRRSAREVHYQDVSGHCGFDVERPGFRIAAEDAGDALSSAPPTSTVVVWMVSPGEAASTGFLAAEKWR